MPRTESIECSLCEEKLVDGDRYVKIVEGAVNPWHDNPDLADAEGSNREFSTLVYHKHHPEVDDLLTAYNQLRYGA